MLLNRKAQRRIDRDGEKADRSAWRRLNGLQPAIWLFVGLLYFAFDTGRIGESWQAWLFLRALCWALIGGLLATGLGFIYGRFRIERLRAGWITTIAASGCLVVSFLWLALFNELDGLVGFEPGYRPTSELEAEEIFGEMFDRVLTSIIWHFIAFSVVYSHNIKRERERVLRLEKLATEAQMEVLRGQLNPHFFFNSLNSAIALIDEDPDAAQRFLTGLSSLLRDTLASNVARDVSLDRELELVRRYVEIEQVRFEEKLVYKEDVSPDAGVRMIPSLLVLPLVENAIKHGMRTSAMPLRIELAAKLENTRLEIAVSNTGRLEVERHGSDATADPEDCGIGIANLKGRLSSELPGCHRFSLTEKDGLVRADIIIDLGLDANPAEIPL